MMAYSELTCEDIGLTLDDLYVGGLGKMGDGSFAQQVVNVQVFDPLFRANKPVGIACWASILCPDRTLIAGDLLFRAQFS